MDELISPESILSIPQQKAEEKGEGVSLAREPRASEDSIDRVI